MAQRINQRAQPAQTVTLAPLNLGYNDYIDPTLAQPKQWRPGTQNVFTGPFGYLQRARFAKVVEAAVSSYVAQSAYFTSLYNFRIPDPLASYVLGDINGKLYAFNTGSSYAAVQRLSPYYDPTGAGSALFDGPWSRFSIGSFCYEMNGQIKQSGRGTSAATIEGFGLDSPDNSGVVVLTGPATDYTIGSTAGDISRAANVVTVTVTTSFGLIRLGDSINITGVDDDSFNGTFAITSTPTSTTFTYDQIGQDASSQNGTASYNVTKTIGRSYQWAWENANKSHVGPPSPATQYFKYTTQWGQMQATQPGTISVTSGSTAVTGTATFFSSAWVGKYIYRGVGAGIGPIASVTDATHLTLASNSAYTSSGVFQIYDPQATHIRLYATADGGATYYRIARNAFDPTATDITLSGLYFDDTSNSEPPDFPFTTEVSQAYNIPPPVGSYIEQYQGNLIIYGVSGAPQSFFYTNSSLTDVGLPQESSAPLNFFTLPIRDAKINGSAALPTSLILWSDKDMMFKLTGLLQDNTSDASAAPSSTQQQGATVQQLPYQLGCACRFAKAVTPLGAIWLTPNLEVWLYTDQYAPRNIGRPVQTILSSINRSALDACRMTYYRRGLRNWLALLVPTGTNTTPDTVLILDIDLLASNGSPSFFVFDMATNHPAWYVYKTTSTWLLETIQEDATFRLLTAGYDIITDIDYDGSSYKSSTELDVAGQLFLHPWGNDSPSIIKKPSWMRFIVNTAPTDIYASDWRFKVEGVDDDYYTFDVPISLDLVPGQNDVETLSGQPYNPVTPFAFKFGPTLFKMGAVNYVQGRRIMADVIFPSAPGEWILRQVQIGFGALPPR